MFNHPDRFDPTAAEPELPFPTDRSGPTEDPDPVSAALLAMYWELSVAKQHSLVMDFLSRVGRFPGTAPVNAAMVLIPDPDATFLAGPAEWRSYGRVPAPGTRPVTVLVPLGPVDYVWDIRHTVPLARTSGGTEPLDPRERHRLAVTVYPADLTHCTGRLLGYADTLASTDPESRRERYGLASSEDARACRRRRVQELSARWAGHSPEEVDVRTVFRDTLRTAAGFLLAHDAVPGARNWPVSSRAHIHPDAKIFEVATVEWIITQMLTDDSTPPPDLTGYRDGSSVIPGDVHLQKVITAAGRIRRELLPVLPPEWSPEQR